MLKRNIIAALVALTASASAGQKISSPVTITFYTGYRAANGSMATARATADSIQYIGCEMYGYEAYSSVYCTARDEAGNVAACYAREAEEIKKVAFSITDGSYIAFQTSSTEYTKCSSLNVRTSSKYAPPQL